jgi:hypothetical protein
MASINIIQKSFNSIRMADGNNEWRIKMSIKDLWEFPVPSTYIADGGVVLLYPGGDVQLLYDYYDEQEKNTVFHSGITFEGVQSFRHTTEKFLTSLNGTYDHLVEMIDSKWIKELREINKEVFDYWQLKHYAIFLDSHGLYEFVANNYKVLQTKRGGLNGLPKIE